MDQQKGVPPGMVLAKVQREDVVRALCIMCGLAIAGSATAASAQERHLASECQVRSIADLPACVQLGERVVVTTTEGREVSGTFSGFSKDRLLLEVRDVVRFTSLAEADALQIAVVRPERSAENVGKGIGGGLQIGLALATGASTARGAWSLVLGMSALGGVGGWLTPVDVARVVLDPASRASAPVAAPFLPVPHIDSALAQLPARLVPGDSLRVHQLDGALVLGRYGGVDDGALLVRIGDRVHRVREDGIGSIERFTKRSPSLRTGAGIGAAIVAGLFILGSTVDTSEAPVEELSAAEFAGGLMASAGMGAAIGAGVTRIVDRRESELLLYRPRPTNARSNRGVALAWRLAF
jgi:hypothetical protein